MANVRGRKTVDELNEEKEKQRLRRRGEPGEVYAPTVGIPEEMGEYDKVRQKNIEERQRKFRELGLQEAKAKFK